MLNDPGARPNLPAASFRSWRLDHLYRRITFSGRGASTRAAYSSVVGNFAVGLPAAHTEKAWARHFNEPETSTPPQSADWFGRPDSPPDSRRYPAPRSGMGGDTRRFDSHGRAGIGSENWLQARRARGHHAGCLIKGPMTFRAAVRIGPYSHPSSGGLRANT